MKPLPRVDDFTWAVDMNYSDLPCEARKRSPLCFPSPDRIRLRWVPLLQREVSLERVDSCLRISLSYLDFVDSTCGFILFRRQRTESHIFRTVNTTLPRPPGIYTSETCKRRKTPKIPNSIN